jgi:hypothetical protein
MMRFLLTYARFYRSAFASAAIVAVFGLLALLAFTLRPATSNSLTLLGDITAAREPTTVPVDANSGLAPLPRPIAAHIDTADRTDAVEQAPDERLQEPLLAALNCVRAGAGQPKLVLDQQLSDDAAALWQALVARPKASLGDLAGTRYVLVSVLALTLGDSASTAPGAPCSFGEVDMTMLDLQQANRVGIAVFPDPHPQDGLDESSAVLVAQ